MENIQNPTTHSEETKISTCRRSTRKKRCINDWALYDYSVNKRFNKRSRTNYSILNLPNEILVSIFSYVSPSDLLYGVRGTCKRFNNVAESPPLWRRLNIDEQISTSSAKAMLNISGQFCQELILKNRVDTNSLLEHTSKVLKNLKKIEIISCKGSKFGICLKSLVLCNLINRLKQLQFFTICCTRFNSCRFFKLLARRRPYKNAKFSIPVIYTGPVNSKQIQIHFLTAFEDTFMNTVKEKINVELNQIFEMYGTGYLKGRVVNNPNGKPIIIYDIQFNAD